jgi:hypothetical protein
MNVSPDYAWLSIILSLASLTLLCWHLPRSIASYKHFHDDRAAVSLVLSIGSIVVALGLLISGVGLLVNDSQFSTAGLSLSRGALILLAATLVFADVRHTP